MSPKFINLKVKTDYSLSRSAVRYKSLIKLAKERKIPALGICDDGNLFGSLEFSDECVKNGIQPIIGCNLTLHCENGYFGQINLFAKNEQGYKNLLYLSSMTKLEWGGKVPLKELLERNEGLILLSGGAGGVLAYFVMQDDIAETESLIGQFEAYFKDRFYIEITRHGTPLENDIEPKLLYLATEHNLPIVATQDVYFMQKDEWEAAETLLCVGLGRFLVENDRERYSPECYFKTESQMCEIFADLPEALENSVNIALRCSFWSKGADPMLPPFKAESGLNENDELEKQSKEGLKRRFEHHPIADGYAKEDYEKRLDFELDVIKKMGFAGYFLIVSDFIKWSKNNGVAVGPGRGSGAGSIVAWVLEITDLDPIFYGLLFERFLNPDRVSMPDFDIDFCQENRHRAIEYVQAKYGTDKVAAIITFGKLQARAVLKDVGRVLQMPYSQVDKISKMIPFNPVEPVTLEKAISLDPELKSQQASDPDLAKLLDIGLKLEGLNRHSSTHAAGIIIGGKSLIELVPLSKDEGHELPVVGYNMKAAEKAGLVKFDFLGLKTLTVIANTVKLVKEIRDIQVDISKIDMFDKATFELLQSGHTRGVFQLDSVICKDAMKQMKIGDIKEIIALTSLNRPGPMENIPSYIARKIGKEAVEYPHPLLTQVLGETFGIIIYQEQVMQVAQILAGYTLGQADLLRRAMGKKIKEEMDAQRAIFVDGAVKNSVEGKKASEIFDLVEKFAGYGFNKSHAAAYSVISYQTAYLKAHYPIEFFTAYLNIAINDTDDLNLFVSEARQMGIEITLPDVNESEAKFTIQNGRIIYALGALKAVGIGIIEELVQIRKTSGIFRDIFDFCGRVGAKIANKRAIESFAKVGAFDKIYPNRREIVENVAKLTAFAANHQKELETACVGLFGDEVSAGIEPPKLDKFADYTQIERFMAEFEAVGYYLSAHPLSAYTAELEANGIVQSDKLEEIVSEKEVKIKMAGVISIVRQRSGKRGRFAFVHLSDLGGIYETCIFSDKLITQKRDLIKEGTLVYAEVAVQKQENGAARIIINELHALSEFVKNPRLASQKVQNMPQPKPPVITPALEPIPEPKIEPKLEAKIVRFLVKKPQHIKAFAQNLAKYKSESGTQVILEINNHKFHLYNQNYNLTTSDIQNLSEIIN